MPQSGGWRENGKADLCETVCARMTQGVIIQDDEGRVIRANMAAEHILGIGANKLQGMAMGDLAQKMICEDGSPYPLDDLPPVIAQCTGEVIQGVIVGIANGHDETPRWLSVCSVPIFLENGRTFRHVFSTFEDVTKIVTLKQRLAVALGRQREVCNILQRALLPYGMVQSPGYRIAMRYIPAYEGDIVCGDLADSFLTKDDKIAVVIGDAAGKGLKVASYAAMARSTIRALGYGSSSPAETLTLTNEVICARRPEGHDEGFITACLMLIDPVSGAFQYANAGHLPAVLLPKSGENTVLPDGQLALGIEDCNYIQVNGQLFPGDKIFLYTDGLTEARSAQGSFGEEAVHCLLHEVRSLTAEELLDKMLVAASAWAGGRSHDDLAMIAIERLKE